MTGASDNPSGEGARSRHQALKDAAGAYGEASLRNYSNIRSLAERIADGLCVFLAPGGARCVYLVPPAGPFAPVDHGSAAFSVSGAGFLPLEPIAFGLALRVSDTGDWLRLIVTCMQEGGRMTATLGDGERHVFALPVSDAALAEFFERLYQIAREWFESRVRLYESGVYGGSTIGFELIHIDADAPEPADASRSVGAPESLAAPVPPPRARADAPPEEPCCADETA